jgi:pimeloyl-ACP methyl ester carboxylesterase
MDGMGDGVTIRYDDEGEAGAPVLLLVHGHPFDRSMWRPQAEGLGRSGWRVIVPDLRGYGQSTVVPGTTPMPVFARDLAGLLDREGIDRVVLGGLSMGGQIVMEFAGLFPERLRGLVIAATSARADTKEAGRARRATADRVVREGMGPYAAELLPRMVAPATLRDRPEVVEHVRRMMRGAPPEGAAAALRGRAGRPGHTGTLTHLTEHSTVPTLVVVGTEDAFTPVEEARHIHECVPGSTLAVIEGAGHLPNLERPAEFDRVLRGFLDALT